VKPARLQRQSGLDAEHEVLGHVRRLDSGYWRCGRRWRRGNPASGVETLAMLPPPGWSSRRIEPSRLMTLSFASRPLDGAPRLVTVPVCQFSRNAGTRAVAARGSPTPCRPRRPAHLPSGYPTKGLVSAVEPHRAHVGCAAYSRRRTCPHAGVLEASAMGARERDCTDTQSVDVPT
jgi:hypothetical protein